MKPWIAVGFSLVLVAASTAASLFLHLNIMLAMVVFTSLWAAYDSAKIQLKRYRSGISYGPLMLFIGCLAIWIIGFPWYLAMRYKIKRGTAILKDAAETDVA